MNARSPIERLRRNENEPSRRRAVANVQDEAANATSGWPYARVRRVWGGRRVPSRVYAWDARLTFFEEEGHISLSARHMPEILSAVVAAAKKYL